jgi:plastocyanin
MHSAKRNTRLPKGTFVLFVAVVVALGSTVYAISAALPSSNLVTDSAIPEAHAQHAATDAATTVADNTPQEIDLDGVTLTFAAPEKVHAYSQSTIKMTVSDTESGKPLTHVDWSVIVESPSGEQVYKSNTLHSHVGTMELNYAFLEPGENTVSVQVASLGPTMMGMEVPGMAQTRILLSGDPMMGWQTDPNFFFGTRNTEFKVNVEGQGVIKTIDGTEAGTDITLEVATNPGRVIAGQPTTLILNVERADNGEPVTHSEALLNIRGSSRPFSSAPMGNPMMPVSGSFHGHTGQMAFTTTFPTSGVYIITTNLNSLPVSNYMFGQATTNFRIYVEDAEGSGDNTPVTVTPDQPNHIAILGQDAPFYGPNNLTVKAGTAITVVNHDSIPHTLTSTADAAGVQSPTASDVFDTGVLMMNGEAQITIDEPGTYNYFCTIHPFMRGTITVTG